MGAASFVDRYARAVLVERVDFTSNLAVFRFEVDEKIPFQPGQYATLGLEDGEKFLQRPYSIVSAPHESFMEFFVELVDDGTLTPRLWNLSPGGRVWIRKRAAGKFTLDERTAHRKHLMAATVTGVAPFVSMIRSQEAEFIRGNKKSHEMLLIHGASKSIEFGSYLEELKDFGKREWIHYVPTISRPKDDPSWAGETGRIEDILRKYADDLEYTWENSVAYACGHPGMIANVKNILLRARFRDDQIREEEYFVMKEDAEIAHSERASP